ncbi:MAG: hypothetical protein ACTSVL_00930 [Promethearchaeota archaeon]
MGNNLRINALLLHGDPGKIHEDFESSDSFFLEQQLNTIIMKE